MHSRYSNIAESSGDEEMRWILRAIVLMMFGLYLHAILGAGVGSRFSNLFRRVRFSRIKVFWKIGGNLRILIG